MSISLKKIDFDVLSICALLIGPSINYYSNDLIQYVYGGRSISAVVYILLALLGIRSYSVLFKKKYKNQKVKKTIVAVAAVMLFSFIVHPSIGELILSPDFNPLKSVGLFLFLYGFPLMILCSQACDWELILKYLFILSLFVIVLAAMDYFMVMLVFPIGSEEEVNYMSFSYNQLLGGSVCVVYGYKTKRYWPHLVSLLSFFLIFIGGARGALFCLLVLYLLLFLYNLTSRKVVLIIVSSIVLVIVSQTLFNTFLSTSASVVEDIGGFSRTLYKITEGEAFKSKGRDEIGQIINTAIVDNPIGYGLLGDRYVLSQHKLVGYAHSIVLEFLCDFGVIVGVILLLGLLRMIIKAFANRKESRCSFLYLALLPPGFIMLLMSGSFLDEAFAFWALLGILYNPITYVKKKTSVVV